MPEKSRDEKAKETASLMQEFLDQLERITRQFPGSRLLVDLARDSGLEMARKMGQRAKKLRVRLEKAESRRHDLRRAHKLSL